MKTKTLYSIREYGINGSCYSKVIFGGRVIDRARAMRIVKRLKRAGRDVIAAPIKIAV
jgi:hypothetical protein